MASKYPNNKFTAPSGNTYTYHYHPSAPNEPTLLFLHGFPSTSRDWRHQISYFSSKGYGILAPDLLGYGLSSKPLDVQQYVGAAMSRDIIYLLNHHDLTNGSVVGVAHDWGTYLLSQLAFRYPDYFKSFVFISVPYQPPGRGMNIDRVNAVTKKLSGFESYGYWNFLTSPEAGKLIGKKWDSFFSIAYCEDAKNWTTDFAGIGQLESFLKADRKVPLGEWVGDAEEEARWHHEMFGDDYGPTLRWYHRGISNLGSNEEREMVVRGEIKEQIGKETLMITGTEDRVCDAKRAATTMHDWVDNPKDNLKCVDLKAGHWVMLEQRDELNRALEDFLQHGSRSQGLRARI